MPQFTQESSTRHSPKAIPYSQLQDAEKSSRSILIRGKTPEEVYEFWRNFQNLPHFMKDLENVQVLSSTLSHWTIKLEQGPQVEWDAEILDERPGEMIVWQSVGDSDVKQMGAVWFVEAPADRGTIVRLSINYSVPGGKLSEWITKLNGEDPDSLIITNLRRLKAYMETGEIPTIQGQPSGREEDSRPVQTH